jgi:thiol-disulfide isomerase/thioredoxin
MRVRCSTEMSPELRRPLGVRYFTLWVVIGLVAVSSAVGYYIFNGSTQSSVSIGGPVIGMPVSASVLSQLSGVSIGTLSQVGSDQAGVASTRPTGSNTPLVLDGKPEVLYMGAEYCPYCAAERWAMVVALDKFGGFTGLEYMQSSSTDVYPNTPTFTFKDATYASSYVAFVSVEQIDRNGQPLQTPTANETALLRQYGSAVGAIPFLDFGNQYALTGAQYSPAILRVGGSVTGAPYNWTQIASQLDSGNSIFAKNIDGAANHLIAAICKIDGGQPASVCSQGFAQLVSYSRDPPSVGTPLLVFEAVSGRSARSPASQNEGLEWK